MDRQLQALIDRVAETEEKFVLLSEEPQRDVTLYPALLFKDQLCQLESLADRRGEAVAAMIRSAVDAYLFRERFKQPAQSLSGKVRDMGR